MEVTIDYNGQALSVEVTVEVCKYVDRADHKEENLAHEQRRHWDGWEFDEYIAFTESVGAYSETPEDYLCRKETLDELLSVLARCTDTQQRRFLLYVLDGFTYEQIALLDGCSKISVYESIEAVRKKFQKNFADQPTMSQLWAVQQEMSQPTSRSGKLKKLQAQAGLFNLLNGNGITTMQQLYEKIAAMNTDYYALRGEIVSGERQIKKLEEHIAMYEQYEKHKGIRRQLDKVRPGKRDLFEQRHHAELALYEAAVRYLEDLKTAGEPITPKKWRREVETLTAKKDLQYQDMRAMREEIKAVETFTKSR